MSIPTRSIKALVTGFDATWANTYEENLAIAKTFTYLISVFGESGNHNTASKLLQLKLSLGSSKIEDLEWIDKETLARIESEIL